MSFLKSILDDLREKKLWPLAALLLAAVIAVPLLFSRGGSGGSATVAGHPSAASPGGAVSGLPAVNVTGVPTESRLLGKGRDPFAQLGGSGATGTGGAAATLAAGAPSTGLGVVGAGTSPGAGASTGPSVGSGSSAGTTTTIAATPSITGPAPKPAPPGLSDTESYEVSLAITTASGGLDTYAPLERLSVLPSASDPLLVELGVLKGGRRVLFALQPDAVVYGPGSCIPGPVDCEILSLAPGQTEQLGQRTATGAQQVALFAVTAVTVSRQRSVAAADQARSATAAAGRELIARSTSGALSLFRYEERIGALVDLRNLTVGS